MASGPGRRDKRYLVAIPAKRDKFSWCQPATAGGAFLANRDRIETFVTRMGEELNQDAVFVLAFDSDSFLIELEEGG